MRWLRNIFRGRNMTALLSGKQAPPFNLPTMDGTQFSLRDALTQGPVVAAFFKVSCPVCQYTFPFLERIYKNYGGPPVSFVGISQNDKKDTASFVRQYSVSFPILLDDTKNFPVSNAYSLTNVPTIFWIAQDGEIQISSVGWSRADIEEIATKAAPAIGNQRKPLFRAEENIPEFRAG
jgi:peroxiredoxin